MTAASSALSNSNENLDIEYDGSECHIDYHGHKREKVTLPKSCETVNIVHHASGSLKVNGNCQTLTIRYAGSGDLLLNSLSTESLKLSHRGSGDVHVKVEKVAQIRMKGSGDVFLEGDARVSIENTGSGELINDAF